MRATLTTTDEHHIPLGELDEENSIRLLNLLHTQLEWFLPLRDIFPISNRLYNILRQNNLVTLYDVSQYDLTRWRHVKRMGATSYFELRKFAKEKKLILPDWMDLPLRERAA